MLENIVNLQEVNAVSYGFNLTFQLLSLGNFPRKIKAIRVGMELKSATRNEQNSRHNASSFAITHGNQTLPRTLVVVQRKTQRPFQFKLTEPIRAARPPQVSTRQYARIAHQRIAAVGRDTTADGTQTMRRTRATLIYKRTKNLRAIQLLLGHTKLESTVRYPDIELDDENLRADRDIAESCFHSSPASQV